jgi:hypothetical protein
MYPVLLVPDVGFKFYFFLMILPEICEIWDLLVEAHQ